jgi:hypothetical protein
MKNRFLFSATRLGSVRLLFRKSLVPASSCYIEHLLADRGIVVEPGQSMPAPADLVKDILEEALANVGHALLSFEAQKRELLRLALIAEEIASKAVA